MARLPGTEGAAEVAARIRERRGGALRPIDLMLLHSAPLAESWSVLLSTVRRRLSLPPDVRELVILRVAVLNGAEYEWNAHEAEARRVGLDEACLVAIAGPGAAGDPALDDRQRRVVAYTDAMTRQIQVPDAVFDALRADFSDPQLVELTATVATYNMVSRFLIALRVGVA